MMLLIRADAGSQIGTGHVMRCLALAQAWQDSGGHVMVASAPLSAALIERLMAEKITLAEITAEPGSASDAQQTIDLAYRQSAQWVVVDGYHFGGEYQRVLKSAGLRVLFIDDYGHADRYSADLVLNQNLHAHESLYVRKEAYTRLLLGPRYVLLRREFWRWQGWQRETPDIARKVLVTLGGSDPDNVTCKVIRSLEQVAVPDLEAVVVVGGSNPHHAELQATVHSTRFPIRLEQNVSDMPALMAWADVAVSAGGSTCWELAYMGVPAIIVLLVENQRLVAESLEVANFGLNLGWHTRLTDNTVRDAIAYLLASSEQRERSRCVGQQMVDGIGGVRVSGAMIGDHLTLRPAAMEDCELLWRWVNDPAVRAASFQSAFIPWETHLQWFDRKLADHRCYILIALDQNHTPVGQVRFDVRDDGDAEIGVSVSPTHRGQGHGAMIIRLAAIELVGQSAVRRIHAYVKQDNIVSVRAFLKAGFVRMSEEVRSGYPCIHLLWSTE